MRSEAVMCWGVACRPIFTRFGYFTKSNLPNVVFLDVIYTIDTRFRDLCLYIFCRRNFHSSMYIAFGTYWWGLVRKQLSLQWTSLGPYIMRRLRNHIRCVLHMHLRENLSHWLKQTDHSTLNNSNRSDFFSLPLWWGKAAVCKK